MRAALLVLALSLAAATAFAGSALADISVNGLPVNFCLNGTCTPCLDPVTVPAPVVDFALSGAPCAA